MSAAVRVTEGHYQIEAALFRMRGLLPWRITATCPDSLGCDCLRSRFSESV